MGDRSDDEVRRELAPRPAGGLGTWPWIGVGAGITLAGLALVAVTQPCDQFHVAVELAGSDRRLAPWIAGCDPDLGAARATLAADVVLIVGYVLLLASILRRWWPLYQAPRLKALERAVVALPVVVGALDLVENALIAIGLDVRDGRFAYPNGLALPVAVATIAWLKWLLLVAAALAAVMAVMLAVARRHEADRPALSAAPASRPAATPPEGLGICCSGGGIRAAFSLGALRELEEAGVTGRARWLSAVSGGAYAATAWQLAKAADPARPAAADVIDWLETPIPGSPAGRHRFLRNGPGGLGRPLAAAVAYISFNLLALAALVFALAWPLGRLIGSYAVQPVLSTTGGLPDELYLYAELWLPGVILLAVAGLLLALSALPSYRLVVMWRVAVVVAALGLVLEVLLILTPVVMVNVGRWMQAGTASLRPAALGTTALVGVATAAWRIVSKPVVSRLSDRAPELGGLLLAAAALLWGGKVATDAATHAGLFRDVGWWVAATVGFVVVYLFVGTSQISIHRIYRKRLRRTFGLARDADGALFAPGDDGQRTWADLPRVGPELLICCAQQRTGIANGGLPAESFTISRDEVRIGDDVVPTELYLSRLPADLHAEHAVASWTATSGAAFASAMGRLSKGSTNALLAALNIDLGIWLPNPRLVADPGADFPKVRLGYLFKEILGWYDPADRYVFVADGGHWENLGLVELLRRRCATILCVDASGDAIGAYTTLRQAVELAMLELPDVVADVDLAGLEEITPPPGAMAGGIVATLAVTYRGPGTTSFPGTIYYAKAQLARDLDIALRRFAKQDRRFPNYSTGDQFLTDRQFGELLALGRAAGQRLAVREAGPPPVPDDPPTIPAAIPPAIPPT